MSVTVKLDTTKLDQLLAQIPNRANQATRQAAFAIEAQAKVNIQKWDLIDTGAMINSMAVSRERPGLYQIGDFGGYTKSRKSKFGWRSINAGMEYAVYWELGHRNIFLRRYVRKPFLEPALRFVEASFMQMLAQGLFK